MYPKPYTGCFRLNNRLPRQKSTRPVYGTFRITDRGNDFPFSGYLRMENLHHPGRRSLKPQPLFISPDVLSSEKRNLHLFGLHLPAEIGHPGCIDLLDYTHQHRQRRLNHLMSPFDGPVGDDLPISDLLYLADVSEDPEDLR